MSLSSLLRRFSNSYNRQNKKACSSNGIVVASQFWSQAVSNAPGLENPEIIPQHLCSQPVHRNVWSLGQLPRRLHASTDISGLAHMSSRGLHLFQVYEFHDD